MDDKALKVDASFDQDTSLDTLAFELDSLFCSTPPDSHQLEITFEWTDALLMHTTTAWQPSKPDVTSNPMSVQPVSDVESEQGPSKEKFLDPLEDEKEPCYVPSSEPTAIVVQPRPPPSPNPSTEHHAMSESPLSDPKSCIEPNPAQSLTDHQVSARVLLEQISIKSSHGDVDATVITEHQIGLVVKQPTAPPYQLIDGKRWGAIMCFLLHVLLSSSYNWDSSMLDEASTVGDKWINPAGTRPAAAPNFCQVIAICESNYGEGTSLPHPRHRAFLDVLSSIPDTHPIPYNGCPPFML